MRYSVEHSASVSAGLETLEQPAESWVGRIRARLLRDIAVPGAVWRRVGLLFVVLCLIKVWMLISFGKNLYQIHWRVAPDPLTWGGETSLYLLAFLWTLNLWAFGTRCEGQGVKVVRAANASVLVLAAAFILLTFHTGEKNYLYPVMERILSWKDLKWYFSMDFFFRSPFLSVWLLAYGAVYYGLARTGHERLVLRVTAVAGGAYLVLCLRFLAYYPEALILADCVGIVCLVAAHGARRPLHLFWFSLPLLWTSFLWLLFSRFDTRLTLPRWNPELLVMMCTALVLFSGATLWAWWRGFFASWSWMLPFAFLTFLLLVNMNYDLALNYQHLLCVGLTLPRYFLGEFCLTAILLAAAVGYCRWRPAGSLAWLDALNLAVIAWALADLRLTQVMGVRLDWHALSLAYGETPRMMWRMAQPYLPALIVVLLLTGICYAGLLRAGRSERGRRWLAAGPEAKHGLRFALFSFVVLALAGTWLAERDKAEDQSLFLLAKTSPLWRKASTPIMDERTFDETARRLGMGQMLAPQASLARKPRDLNVVLVFQESSYNKYLSLFDGKQETQPLLSRYRDRMELFPNFFSNFADSINSRFATFTGLYPVQDYKAFTLRRIPVKSIFEVLNENGYSCSMFYSSYFDYTGFGDLLRGRGIGEMYDADNMPGPRKSKPVSWGLREGETLAAIQQRIRDYALEKKKFFLTYVPAAPHMPYDGTPTQFRKYPPGRMGDYTPVYMNELLYMDWVISSIVDQLKESGLLDHTLVVITDDHGEMLGENGGPVGHGWALRPELANIPLIIMDPGKRGCRTNYTIGSQVDLLPTMLDILGIPVPSDQCYQGCSLYSAYARTRRTIYLNAFREYGIISDDLLFCGDRDSGGRKGPGFSGQAFTISNRGPQTIFTETQPLAQLPPSISRFDEFQENLLLHYSHYCQMEHRQIAVK